MTNNFLVEYKRKKDRKINKKNIIEESLTQLKDIDLLNIPVAELYRSINIIQQNLKNM